MTSASTTKMYKVGKSGYYSLILAFPKSFESKEVIQLQPKVHALTLTFV